MHLYLIRHADPIYDPDGLTEQGKKEAEALVKRLTDFGVNKIYSSNSIRSQETVRPTSEALKIPTTVFNWFHEPSEIKIEQDGKPYCVWDIYGENVRNTSPLPNDQTWMERYPFDSPVIKKHWDEFTANCDDFIETLGYKREGNVYKIQNSNDDRVVISCHNGTVLYLISYLLNIPLPLVFTGFYAWPASITDIYFDERSPEIAVPRALHVSDVSHIIGNGMTPQARGMGDRCPEYY